MKVKFLSVATIVALFIASCGGVDKSVVDDIKKFESEWTSMSKDVVGMSESMAKENAEQGKECDEICSKDCKDKKKQGTMDSLENHCKMAREGMASSMTNVATFKTDVDKATADFTAWKDKVMKGDITAEQAKKDLEVYKTKLTESKEQMTAFKDGFDTSKKTCKESCSEAKDCCEKM